LNGTSKHEQYGAHVGRIARGAGISSFGHVVGRALNFALQFALARMYGPAQLGLYVLGMTLVQLANMLAQLGMSQGLVRYVPRYQSQGDTARVRGTILLALWVAFVMSLGIAVLLFFTAGYVATSVFHEPLLETVIRTFSVSLPLFTILSMATWATQGFRTVKYDVYVHQVQLPLSNLALVVLFYLLGAPILGAVTAYVVSTAAGAVIALYYLKRVFPKLFDRSVPPKYEPRELLGFSIPMIVTNVGQNLNIWVGTTALGIFATASSVGTFNVAVRTAALSTIFRGVFGGIFAPMISNLYSRGKLVDLNNLYQDVSRWAFTGSFAVFLVTTLLAKDIMACFGPQFVASWMVLIILAAAQAFNISTGHTGRLLAMTGNHRIVASATLITTVTNIVVTVALVHSLGALGAGLGAAAATVLSNILLMLAVIRRLGFRAYNRSYLKPLTAGMFAVAATLLCKLTLPLPMGAISVLVFGTFFMLMFAGLLVALGLTPSDRQLLASLRTAFRGKERGGVS
jgi:O-antigen/teichoic acid export membrane protein